MARSRADSGGSPPERREEVIRILQAISDEILRTAAEIEDLGSIVTSDLATGDRFARSRKREAFHLLMERCAANASLLRAATTAIKQNSPDPLADFGEAIGSVRFETVRKRLQASLAADEGRAPRRRQSRSQG